MAVKPIPFTGPMVIATLREIAAPGMGKSMTRRVLKPQPVCYQDPPSFSWGKHEGLWPDDWFGYGNAIDGDLPHQPGDLLYVRETWAQCTGCNGPENNGVIYRADDTPNAHRWRPSIHMRKEFSRITLSVTAVKVERLQDISEEDAFKEGIYRVDPAPEEIASGDCTAEDFVFMAPGTRQGWGLTKEDRNREQWGPTPEFAFRCLWDSIYAKRGYGWESNPFVVAVSFRPILRNIDEVLNERAD